MERTRAELARLLTPAATHWDVDLEVALPRLAVFAELLLEWGARINLTAARSLADFCSEHLADAFPALPYLPSAGRWIDVGSGAGLPGIVLAIARPDLQGTLLEPTQKRRAFLNAAIRALGLTTKVEADRLDEHAGRVGALYDVAISRAVLPLPAWLEQGRALVPSGGSVIGFASAATAASAPPEAEVRWYDVGAGPRAVVRVRV